MEATKGAAMTASMGIPDLGMITVDEVCFFVRQIARATGLPLLVDGDTGYGEALNVMRLVRELEDAGAAAVQLEDQVLPKKCGHLSDKRLAAAMDDVVNAWTRSRRRVIGVSNEVGSGIVPATPSGRRFRDELGVLNARIAAASDRVWLVTAGLPQKLRQRPKVALEGINQRGRAQRRRRMEQRQEEHGPASDLVHLGRAADAGDPNA